MFKLLAIGLFAGFCFICVTEILRHFPRLGALILTLPIVIPFVFLTMHLRHNDLAPISLLARRSLTYIPLGLPFFIPLAFAQKLQLSFWPAFLIGLLLAGICICSYLWLTPQN